MNMYNGNKNKQSEGGFASLIIAMVLVTVLSLVTVGFAQLMRREQKSALDKQLSSQAYYAAESGLNVASQALNAGYTTPKPGCGPLPAGTTGAGSVLTDNKVGGSADTQSSFPCLLINPTPPDIRSTLDNDVPKTFQMTGVNSTSGTPVAVTRIDVTWNATQGPTTTGGNCSQLKPAGTGANEWGSALSPIQVRLIPAKDMSRDGLIANTMTSIFCPHSKGGSTGIDYSVSHSPETNGAFGYASCNSNGCTTSITGLGNADQPTYNQATNFISLSSLYGNTTVTIKLYSGTEQVSIADAQVLIDSTGKSNDVLKRIQVRKSLKPQYDVLPQYGADGSSAICKQLTLMPQTLSDGVTPGASSRNGCDQN